MIIFVAKIYSAQINETGIPRRKNTDIRFMYSTKFGACTVVGLNGTLVELKMFRFILEYLHFIFIKCPFWTLDGANVKFSTS
jgi:hypothetical protein